MTELGPVFIVGVGRSGTSLVHSILAGHSKLAFPPETGFLRRYVNSRTLGRMAAREGKQAIERILESDKRLARVGLPPEAIVTEAESYGPVTDLGLYRSLLRLYAKARGKSIAGDKDPRLIEFLGLIHCSFPQAHIVHVIRDPRDVLASKKRAHWSRGHHWSRHVFANRVQMSIGRRDGKRLFGDRYHEIIYEALIVDPGEVIGRLCGGLGIEYEPTMLQFSGAARELVSPDELRWKRETLGPLLATNTGKWRSELSCWETAVTERVCATAMAAGDYQQSDAAFRLGVPASLWLRCWSAAFFLSAPVYELSRSIRMKTVGRVV